MTEIRELHTKRELKAFIQFPYDLYKDNPYWVPTLRSDEMNTFDRKKNGAYEHAQARFFMAYKDGKAVGRVCAIFLEKYEEKWGQKRVRFGWFDFIEDREVAFALLDTVRDWAVELGAAAIHGPLGFCDVDPEGILVEGFDSLGSICTIYNFPYYIDYLEAYGFEKDVEWIEYAMDVPKEAPQLYARMAKRVTERTPYRLKTFSSTKELLGYGQQIFDLYNKTYDHLYGAMPLNQRQIQSCIDQYIKMVDPGLVIGIVDDHDTIVGFGIGMATIDKEVKKANGRLFPFGFIPILRAMKHTEGSALVMLLIGLEPRLQRQGVVSIMLDQIARIGNRYHFKEIWVMPELEDNHQVQQIWKVFDPKIVRRRRVYIKYLKEGARVEYDFLAAQHKAYLAAEAGK